MNQITVLKNAGQATQHDLQNWVTSLELLEHLTKALKKEFQCLPLFTETVLGEDWVTYQLNHFEHIQNQLNSAIEWARNPRAMPLKRFLQKPPDTH